MRHMVQWRVATREHGQTIIWIVEVPLIARSEPALSVDLTEIPSASSNIQYDESSSVIIQVWGESESDSENA